MSNAMSRSKSRWKGALLAGAAMAIVSPLAAKAQTGLSLGIYADPLGTATSPNPYANTGNGNPLQNVYVDPFSTDTLYVYATVTGTTAPSATYVDGLNYAYFNVQAVQTGASAALGQITAATPSALFGGGNFNQTTNNPGAGAQGGALGTISTTPSIVVGSNTSIGSVAKPRSSSDIFYNGTANSYTVGSTGSTFTTAASNIVVSGNSVSFLVETLTYVPTAAAFTNPSAKGALNQIAFNVSQPSSTLVSPTTNYVGSNYFVGLPGTPGTGSLNSSPSLNSGYNVSTAYTTSTTQVGFTEAQFGDVNLDGGVNGADLLQVITHFGPGQTQWINGVQEQNGTSVDGADLLDVITNFGPSYGALPAGLGAQAAALLNAGSTSSVPEPTSFVLLTVGGVALMNRRRSRV